MIHVEHLQKGFGQIRAVDDLSFKVSKGEVVGLLGPNGAGKTTTMRVITGFLPADSGSITVDGIPVQEGSVETRRRIGYLPENAPLYPDLEVTDYLSYIAKLREIDVSKRRSRVKGMVDSCGLGQVVGRPIGELSKGYRQRVGLAAAMIHEPAILILDEPTSGLDPNQIAEIRDLIKMIGRERTVILSTHILQEVEATCSRALIISLGKLVGQGTISELIKSGGEQSGYTVSMRAARKKIEQEIAKLKGLSIGKWFTEPASDIQRFTLAGSDGSDRAEDIFRWAVASGFALSELKRDSASLEEVFKELTQA